MAVRPFAAVVLCIIWYFILGNVSFIHVVGQSAFGLLLIH